MATTTDKGARLANAILFPVVGLVLLAIAFSVALIAYTSKSADITALEGERQLLNNSAELQLELLAKEQEAAAVWDLTDYYTRPLSLNHAWLDMNIGKWLYPNHGHDLIVVVGQDGKAVYSSIDGQPTDPDQAQPIIQAVWPLIARTRAKFINSFRRLPSGTFAIERPAVGFTRSIHETGFAHLRDTPAFVAATAISPELRRFVPERYPPAVLLSVKKLTPARLSALAQRAGVTGLMVDPRTEVRDDEAQFALKSPLGRTVGALTWTASRPGTETLSGVGPMLFFLAVAIAGLTGVVLFFTRQSTRQLADSEARAHHAAMHDGLTGLPNREFFANRFRDELACWTADKGLIGAIYIDLDHFKDINDTLGHAAGDDVIREAARRLRVLASDDATLARISGDEFALLLPNCTSRSELERVLKRIQDRFTVPMLINGTNLHVSLSVGAAVAPDDSLSMGELLRKADIALYSAKASGRGRWAFFDNGMEEHVRTRENLAHALREAITRGRLNVVYQPQTTVDGIKVMSVEALLRWTDPVMGTVSPSVFIPIAEEIGLINEIGFYVLRRACQDAAAWPHLSLAVNVSPSQFRHPRFIEDLRETLAACDFPPQRLEIEVTETVFADNDSNILRILKEIQEMGIRVALDDFGIGYSSLSYLRRFAFDTLKIDRSFIADLEVAPQAHAILSTITDLGEALGMKVVAEGVETQQQIAILRRTNCDRLQGFYLSKPVTRDEVMNVATRLAERQARANAIPLLA